MIVIVCVDDGGGMLFNGRRQGQDRVLRERVLRMTDGGRLWMDHYSARQFEGMNAPQLVADDDFLDRAGPGEFCFVEQGDITPCLGRVEQVILYRWNRSYPSDRRFAPVPEPPSWELLRSEDFAGYSHARITEEVYRHDETQ